MSGTEDFFWRTRTFADRDSVHRTAVTRRVERKAALKSWLDSKIPHIASPGKPSASEQKLDHEMEGDTKSDAPQIAALPDAVA